MHVRNLYKTLAFYCCALLAAAIALEFVPARQINDKSQPGFSAQRVADDIRVISKEPHSIQHPKERKVLRDFLFYRLQQMGGRTQVFEYDTIPSKIGGKFSYSNVYAEFAPLLPDSTYSSILLVAHYDSRYRQKVGKDTVYSFGAADDGYGLGVILELVGLALDYRNEWKQGIKVLFTDAEEHNLDGMRSAWEKDRDIFNGVNLVVNIDARGVKGPALLFETSLGNEKVMDLYSYAKDPQGFSLTTFVYKLLPNSTDFSIVKDTIPGMNFAVVDNLKYYHTDLDNYSNISLKSVQHYGDQLEPIVREYLAGEEYGAADAFVGEKDVVFFGLPLLGLFVFSKTGYLFLNIAVFLLFLFVVYVYVKYKMIPLKGILRAFLHMLLFSAVSVGVGLAVAYFLAQYNGFAFDMLNLKYIPYDNNILLSVLLVQSVWLLVFIRLQERKRKFYVWEMMLGSNFLVFLLSLAMYLYAGENYFILFPLATSSVAMFFSVARNFKWLYLVSCALTVLIAVHILYLLYVTVTIGSMSVIMFLWIIYSASVISQYYCLKRREV